MTMVMPQIRPRVAVPRTVLMCRPDHFTVSYRINPWMQPHEPTDTPRAVRQWEELYRTFVRLGFDVQLIDPVPGLPDMVYAANGGQVVDGIAHGARFRHGERAAEGPLYMDWFRRHGFEVSEPVATNEGEGDFLLVGDTVFAGSGFRSDPAAHEEVARVFGREVVSLGLVDPRFYHLDTAFAVLGEDEIAYYPEAFDERSQRLLAERFPDAILVGEQDAVVFGLNCFSDGRNVVVAVQATTFAIQLAERGFVPVRVDVSELLRGGGGVKCCTLELRT